MRPARETNAQNKRRPLLTVSGWLAAGGLGGSGYYLLGSHADTALPHVGLPPDVTLAAGIAAIVAAAVTFTVKVLGWLLRLSQQRQAGRLRLSQQQQAGLLLLQATQTYEEAENTYRLMTGKSSVPPGDPEGPGDDDQGPTAINDQD